MCCTKGDKKGQVKLNIIKCNSEPQWGNMYVLQEDKHCILIDPNVIDIVWLNECQIEYILLTHEHYDHISGVNYWQNKTNAKVVASHDCDIGMQDPNINLSKTFQQFCAIQTVRNIDLEKIQNVNYTCKADIVYDHNLEINWHGNDIHFFALPGHSKGSSGILVNNKALFAGDSLLKDYPVTGCFPGSSKDDWQQISIPNLKMLEDEIRVYSGHFEDFYLKDYRFWDECLFRRARKK